MDQNYTYQSFQYQPSQTTMKIQPVQMQPSKVSLISQNELQNKPVFSSLNENKIFIDSIKKPEFAMVKDLQTDEVKMIDASRITSVHVSYDTNVISIDKTMRGKGCAD